MPPREHSPIDPPSAPKCAARAELSLQAIFTSLDVKHELLEQLRQLRRNLEAISPHPNREEMHRQPVLEAISQHPNREEMHRQPVLKAISQHPKLVLKGAPGAGKSTLVRYIALCLAGEALGEKQTNVALLAEQGWQLSALLPVHVILRDYAARGLPAKQNLWQFITSELQAGELPRCVAPLETHLKEHGGLLLLDGLDEVPEPNERREGLQKAIEQFERDFSKVRILVTTRPYAYDKKWRLTQFDDSELLDFSPEQIETYIGRWYTAAATTQDPDLPPDRATVYAKQLQQEVAQNEKLRDLAKRPLLLALMVSLHRSRGGGALPQRRVDLYNESVKLLLDLWQRPKIIYDLGGQEVDKEPSLLTVLGISDAALRAALSELAYEAHHNQPNLVGTADITRAQLITALDKAIPKEKRDMVNQSVIANYVRDRAGLLEDGDGDILRSSPTAPFRECLAAMHLASQLSFPQNLVELARHDPARWREAVLLGGNSIVQPRYLWSLIEDLYKRQPTPPVQPSEADFWGGFLAGQLWWDSDLRHSPEVDEAVVAGVRNWQVAILTHGVLPPRDRAAAGDVLGELGDPRAGILEVDEMGLCPVPAGRCWLGNDEGQSHWRQGSWQARWYDGLDQPYWLAQYPVTVGQWRQFVRESGYEPEYNDSLNGSVNCRVIWVNKYDSIAFCTWLDQRWRAKGWLPDGYHVILPSEAEWEKAARGGHRDWGWG